MLENHNQEKIVLKRIGTLITLTFVVVFLALPFLNQPVTAAEINCKSPPLHFNPKNASPAELKSFGLPLPPKGDSKQVDNWVDLINHSNHHDCSLPQPTSKRSIPPTHTSLANNFAGITPQSVIGSYTNDVWSGYVATNGGFDWAFANWNEPCTYPMRVPTLSTATNWVGIGGWFGANLFQAGTTEDRVHGNRFWFETYNNSLNGPFPFLTTIGSSINCGDHLAVQVDYNISCINQSRAFMSDYTSGQYTSTQCLNFQPTNSDAEWIDERLTCNGNKDTQLADFQWVNWSYVEAESTFYGNVLQYASQYNDFKISMYDGSTLLAQPEALGTSTFRDDWYANGTYQGC